MEKYGYRFSFGPWNIHEGADPFGPPVRAGWTFADKLSAYKNLGYDAVQFHDDDVVPDMAELTPQQIRWAAQEMHKKLNAAGLATDFVAPRLWEHPLTIDGAYTANDATARQYAWDRSKICIDIAREMHSDLIVLWLAREGTYLREAKDVPQAMERLIAAVNMMLSYDPDIRIAIEPKPNEPVDLAYIPTIGHALALGAQTQDPSRVGVVMESAHAVLAGLDPADEIGFALAFGKLWNVHLNDQNGLKYDQDRSFGSVNLRGAFNQVRVLEENKYAEIGFVGMDVKALRTQPADLATKHLRNSLDVFLRLVGLVRSLDKKRVNDLLAARDYEELDWLILNHLLRDA
ncbi:MAG: TIM barrel protein [Anaerolineales bacterium]|nr:TIM barrel protein [Anaerolineales bacterium]